MSYDNHAMFYLHGLICSQKGFYLNFKTKLVGTKGANAKEAHGPTAESECLGGNQRLNWTNPKKQ